MRSLAPDSILVNWRSAMMRMYQADWCASPFHRTLLVTLWCSAATSGLVEADHHLQGHLPCFSGTMLTLLSGSRQRPIVQRRKALLGNCPTWVHSQALAMCRHQRLAESGWWPLLDSSGWQWSRASSTSTFTTSRSLCRLTWPIENRVNLLQKIWVCY